MAISKIILNGVTQMDVTQKTVTAGSMLSGTTALKNDGTDITGSIATKTSSDLTSNVLTVTAPAGYYASAASKTLSDANLVAGNIKKDIPIFGVTGTYEGGGSGGSYPWFGPGTTFVERKLNKTINLANDTSFDSWTASTTAGEIKAASSSADFTVTGDYNNAYWVVTRVYVDYAYKSGVTLKNIPKRYSHYYTTLIFPYPNDNANLVGGTNSSVTYANQTARYGIRYYGSTTGTLIYGVGSYGAYFNSAPTVTASGASFSFTLSKLNAKCNTTYFATSRKAYIDSANTNVVVTSDVYKTPVPNSYISWVVENIRTDCTSGL